MEIKKSVFVKSASKLMECPSYDFPEFALIGRSNVGKSSLINFLTNQWWLAKSSKQPWKTVLMNFFLIDDKWSLVDLPWYGYAKAWTFDRVDWMNNLQKLFKRRLNIKRIFVLVDISIEPQDLDLEFMKTLEQENIIFDIIWTKLDKLNQKQLSNNLNLFKNSLDKNLKLDHNMFLTSITKKIWKQEILDYIESIIG